MESERVCRECGLEIIGDVHKDDSGIYHWHEAHCIDALKDRISSLEAALSLDEKNFEKLYDFSRGKCADHWVDLPLHIKNDFRTDFKFYINALRKLAGLEISDGE